MTLDNIWTDDNKLRACFSWLTRIGAAPKFGTRPIGWYQQDQCEAIARVEAALAKHGLAVTARLACRPDGVYAQALKGQRWIKVAQLVCGRIETV